MVCQNIRIGMFAGFSIECLIPNGMSSNISILHGIAYSYLRIILFTKKAIIQFNVSDIDNSSPVALSIMPFTLIRDLYVSSQTLRERSVM